MSDTPPTNNPLERGDARCVTIILDTKEHPSSTQDMST